MRQCTCLTSEPVSNEINLHQTEFLRRKSQFSNPEVTFERDVDLTSTSPPPLKYSSNIKFLQHQDWVSKTIDDLDSLDVHGSPELRIQRRALIMDMQEHQTSLDLIVSQTWDITKLKSNSAESDPTIPKTVDTCTFSLFTSLNLKFNDRIQPTITTALRTWKKCLHLYLRALSRPSYSISSRASQHQPLILAWLLRESQSPRRVSPTSRPAVSTVTFPPQSTFCVEQ